MQRENILKKEDDKPITWSLMDEKVYLNLQDGIKKFVEKNSNKYNIPLDFDFENFRD